MSAKPVIVTLTPDEANYLQESLKLFRNVIETDQRSIKGVQSFNTRASVIEKVTKLIDKVEIARLG